MYSPEVDIDNAVEWIKSLPLEEVLQKLGISEKDIIEQLVDQADEDKVIDLYLADCKDFAYNLKTGTNG